MANLNKTNNYPLSSTQREIWFDQLLHPEIPLYNIGGYVRINGPIEPLVFEQALNQVIQENDALRIILHEAESTPTQTFAEHVHTKLDFYDLSNQENAHQSALKWMKQAFAKPFQLYDKHLFQFSLFKISNNCYYWFGKYHHLITDGWGISLNVQRVATAYNALLANSPIKPTNYSYLDFVKNDLAYLESKKFAEAKRYWLDKYSEVPEPLLMRRYASRFKNQVIPSQRSILYLDRPFYNQLINFAKKNEVSTFHLILGVLYCYFTRILGREDLVIGLPVLNRRTAAFKQTVGLFTGVTSAWFRFGKTLNFIELIQAIRKELQQNYRYQRFPISEINKQLGLYKEGRQQLFDLTLSYAKHEYDVHFNGSPARASYFTHGFETNPLTVFIEEFHLLEDVNIYFDYSLSTFEETEIERLKTRFQFILTEILHRPSVPIHELQIMPEAEINKILFEFNDTATNYPTDKTIIDLFEQQVKKTPHHIAVIFENQQLTYQELNTNANKLAHYLQRLAVKPEVLVGICLERSLEMVIGLLGILKAGGAYVPLDPDYPSQRLQFMLEDSKVPVLLSQSHLLSKLPNLTSTEVVCLDTQWEQISSYSGENLLRQSESMNLAYVIYTSGSTGVSKGVMVEHIALSNFNHSAVKTYLISQKDSVLQFASINFDAAAEEIYPILTQGGRLILRDKGILDTDQTFLQTCQHKAITILDLPTAYWQQLITAPDNQNHWPKSVRLVIIGGEAASMQHVKHWQQTLSQSVQLINTYGPTEATVVVSSYRLTKSIENFSIGKPIPNIQIYILDTNHQPTPLGIPGELCISGVGLARGYLNRPELTAEKFLEVELFGHQQRIYKTGDLARWREDGNLEYLGRIDNQVKIRGFRIELGEIETVLGQHRLVKENAVIVQEDPKIGKRLVVYLVLHESTIEKGEEEFHHFLTSQLPNYMIPSAFITLERLPLTPNGKIDRRTLAQLAVSNEQFLTKNFVAPRTSDEKLLANIFADILGQEQVGIHDNFFELGGHSLLATTVISRIHDNFAIDLPLNNLFKYATVAELVKRIEITRSAIQTLQASSNKTINVQPEEDEEEGIL